MPQEFSAGIIGFKRAETLKFLLLKYPKGYWGFSHGQIEKGESSRDAAIREFKEETGLDIAKMFDGFKEIIEFFYKREGKTVHKEITFYLGESKDGEVKLTEHTDYGWFDFDEALAKLQFKNDQEILKKANEFLIAFYK